MTKRDRRVKRGDEQGILGRGKVKRGLYVAIPLVAIALLAVGAWLLARRRPIEAATPAEVRAEIIPQAGDPTAYDLPLSLDNTQRFIDYDETSSLTPRQERVMEDALLPLKAPCCDDNPMSTCCCDCNLAKSVWGLSSYLIAEKGLGAEQVRGSALQWLRFIRSDYYVGQGLRNRGVNPEKYNLPRGDACYTGRCELPFADDGCGGMGVLRR